MTADGPAARDLVALLAELAIQIQHAAGRHASEQGISAVQARLLQTIGAGAPTISELARSLGLDKSSASGLADRAQRRGFVRRVPSQLDRRSVRVRLTDHGRDALAAVSSALEADLVTMLDPLTSEEAALLTRYLRRLADARRSEDGPGAS